MTEHPRPITESYWVHPGQFLAGEFPGSTDEERARRRVDAFIAAGFNTFIDLTDPNELLPYEPFLRELAGYYGMPVEYHRFTIRDRGLPTPEHMCAILDTIDTALANGRRVYIHCWGGVGRTGTSVGCYLVRHGKTGQQALDQLADWWKYVPKSSYYLHSPETDEQMQFILDWKE